MKRDATLSYLAERIASVEAKHPTRVAIDGIDAAGKTSLADELAVQLRNRGKEVIRASIDGFHNPRRVRYRLGRNSAEGYYLDSFDYDALVESLLGPLGPEGNNEYRESIFDFRQDSRLNSPPKKASYNAILLFDGVFLLRPELISYWDFRIFVEVDVAIAIRRCCLRESEFLSTPVETLNRVCVRYIAGNRIYLQSVNPAKLADIVIENNDFDNPVILNRRQTS